MVDHFCDKCRALQGFIETIDAQGVHRLRECEHNRQFVRAGEIAARFQVTGPSGQGESCTIMVQGESRNHQIAESQIEQSEGIRYAAARAAALDHPDREIAAIILNHRGRARAIRLAEIAETLWPDEWSNRTSQKTIERQIKAAVARLSDPEGQGRLLIGVSRDPERAGYYLIQNAAELDENRIHAWHHVRAWLRRWQAFKPTREEARKLYGELALEFGLDLSPTLHGSSEKDSVSNPHRKL